MGGMDFTCSAKGANAAEAFAAAREQALWDHGHSGYTGSIAEKGEFVIIPVPDSELNIHEFVSKLVREGDPRIDDKWGPAGCIQLDHETWLFFGRASC